MQIVSTPPAYASAYRDTLFGINADPGESVRIDICDATQQIIGKKRLSGSAHYEINVSNYAKRLLEVMPVKRDETGFIRPERRTATISLRSESGGQSDMANTLLGAGIETLTYDRFLTRAPGIKTIASDETDELSFLYTGQRVVASITFTGATENPVIEVTSWQGTAGLLTFCLNMNRLAETLEEAGKGKLKDYYGIQVTITETGRPPLSQNYRLAETTPQSVRLCWWNEYGQIDYYTFRGNATKETNVSKQNIYTSIGYKTTESYTETRFRLLSGFENNATMEWIAALVAAPGVWIAEGGDSIPVDVLTDRVLTRSEQIGRMTLDLRLNKKKYFQHF